MRRAKSPDPSRVLLAVMSVLDVLLQDGRGLDFVVGGTAAAACGGAGLCQCDRPLRQPQFMVEKKNLELLPISKNFSQSASIVGAMRLNIDAD